jgi:hypothetical protein
VKAEQRRKYFADLHPYIPLELVEYQETAGLQATKKRGKKYKNNHSASKTTRISFVIPDKLKRTYAYIHMRIREYIHTYIHVQKETWRKYFGELHPHFITICDRSIVKDRFDSFEYDISKRHVPYYERCGKCEEFLDKPKYW